MIHQRQSDSISNYSPSNLVIWLSMAFQAGLLNIGGFMACHRFVSHVTGFATFFGYEISRKQFTQAAGILSVPVFFLLGTMLSAQLVDVKIRLNQRPKYYVSFGIIFVLLLIITFGGAVGWFGVFGEPLMLSRDYALLALLCGVCGVQNGTITTASKATVRTTHLSGLTTDLGIGLVRLMHRKKLQMSVPEETRSTLMRVGIIGFFGLGSIVGGLVFQRYGYYGFLIPLWTSGVLFGCMVYFQLIKPMLQKK